MVEYRDVEVGTDAIEHMDKEVQFGFGDETDLLNIMACIKSRRTTASKTNGSNDSKDSNENNGKKKNRKSEEQISLLEEAGVISLDKKRISLHSRSVGGDSVENEVLNMESEGLKGGQL